MTPPHRTSQPRTRSLIVSILAAAAIAVSGALPATAAAGALDPAFGNDGKVTAFFGDPNTNRTDAQAMAAQPDGKVIVAGDTGPWDGSSSVFGLMRFDTDGALDPTFGGDGRVKTRFDALSAAVDVAVQSDGKIVAAGWVRPATSDVARVALTRYRPNGSLDPTFGGDGKVVTKVGGNVRVQAVAIQPDGKIVVVGSALFHPHGWLSLVLRYDGNGALDPTFGTNGRVTTMLGTSIGLMDDGWIDVTVQPDGGILTAGTFRLLPSASHVFMVARYDTHGNLDPTFGDGGVATASMGPFKGLGAPDLATSAVLLRSDGSVVVAGTYMEGDGSPGTIRAFALAQFTSAGILDFGFADGGTAVGRVSGGYGTAADAVLAPEGRVVVAGTFQIIGGRTRFLVMRFDAAGMLDPSFANDGRTRTSFGSFVSNGRAAAVQPSGEVTVVGEARFEHATGATTAIFALARYQNA
jgi:uncharacterized delta-60 repeat protein